jgi:hypothetical protein
LNLILGDMTYDDILILRVNCDGNIEFSGMSHLSIFPGKFNIKNEELKTCNKKMFNSRDVQAIFETATRKYWNPLCT